MPTSRSKRQGRQVPLPELPAVAGLLGADQVLATARSIAAAQEPGGAIPWFAGGHTDPWDHVECAMALSATGPTESAVRAYDYLRRTQRPDGSWPAKVRGGVVEDAGSESNQCAYVAVGVWHHLLVTGDERFARQMWSTVRAAIDLVVRLQTDRGEIRWAIDPAGRPVADALLTGSSSTYQSLRCALALADWVGEAVPDWEVAAGRLGHAVRAHPEAFLDKSRFSMDWYYPVLGGAVRDGRGRELLSAGWDEFVVAGLGVRCVSDEPWVTGAETCELVLALDTVGRRDDALGLLEQMQHLRDTDGSYWTGYQFVEDVNWPDEHTTWTAAAVVLAVDALSGVSGGSGIFRAETLPTGLDLRDLDCGCAPEWAALRGSAAQDS
jgi:hypothetical protein